MCLLVVSARNLIQTFLSNKGRIYWLITKPRESRADAKSNLSCPSKPQAWVASGLPSLSLLPRARPTSTATFAFLFSSSAYSKWHWIQLPASSRSSLPLPLIAHICLPAVVVSSMRKGSHWLSWGYVPCTHSCGVLIFKNNCQKSCKIIIKVHNWWSCLFHFCLGTNSKVCLGFSKSHRTHGQV